MKKNISVFLLLIFLFLACREKIVKQESGSNSIDAKQLLRIIQDSSFIKFKKLVDTIKYPLFDSVDTGDGNIFCIAEEADEIGNSLSASMTKELHVGVLHFSTYDKHLFQRFKQEFVDLGFKPSDSHEKSVELENGNIHINIITLKDEEGFESYDIVLVRKN